MQTCLRLSWPIFFRSPARRLKTRSVADNLHISDNHQYRSTEQDPFLLCNTKQGSSHVHTYPPACSPTPRFACQPGVRTWQSRIEQLLLTWPSLPSVCSRQPELISEPGGLGCDYWNFEDHVGFLPPTNIHEGMPELNYATRLYFPIISDQGPTSQAHPAITNTQALPREEQAIQGRNEGYTLVSLACGGGAGSWPPRPALPE